MIDWGQITYGAVLSALAAAAVLAAATRGRRPAVIATGALAATAGPLAWNAILHAAHGEQFFTDAPIAIFPVSWQDTGSGVFTLATAALAFGAGPLGNEAKRQTTGYGLLAALAALATDIYLY